MELVLSEVLRCEFLEPARWLFLSANVPPIVYYTHIPNLTVSLLLAIFVLLQNSRALPNRILFATTLAFVTWVFFALMFWATNRADVIMFAWLMDILAEPLVHIGVFYLLYVLLKKQDLPFWAKVCLGVLYLPIPLFLATNLTLSGFDTATCLATEGPIALYYTYFVEITVTVLLLFFLLRQYFKSSSADIKHEIRSLGIGGMLLLFAFSWGNIVGSFTEDWELGQYGLLGMPLFIGFLVYSIVRFRLFNIKIFATQALVFTSWFALFALLFVNDLATARWVIGVNLVIFGIFGYQLILSVKQEIAQRRKIEVLAEQLKRANKRLRELDQIKSEFVSIASHQLRSPLTSIRGYASMLLEGSYGKIPKKAVGPLEHIHDSSRYMALSIEDFLNVSRIESGRMKYSYSEFNLKDLAKDIADETRPVALKKGLLLTFRSSCKTGCMVRADIGKVRQVLHNLIDNSIKYTPKGTITVIAHDDPKKKKMYISVKDTGIGMNKEAIQNLFEKFVRAKNANSVNVTGSGLGLYVARQMINQMGGTITPASEGPKKGSTFTLELPLAKKKK